MLIKRELSKESMKVLIVDTNPMIYDGIFSAIMNYAENIDKTDLTIDFVAINSNVEKSIKKRINELGSNLYILEERNSRTLNYIRKLSKLIRGNHYNLVHAHGSSCTLVTELIASALANTPCCPHSHNTNCQHKVAHRLLKPLFCVLYRSGFACGEEAGKWLYGNRNFVVLNNGINVDRFAFSLEDRGIYREKYGINSEDTVLIHIAHFTETKNHKFLIDCYDELLKKSSNYKLLLIGQGVKEFDIRRLVKKKQIEDKVIFIGTTMSIPELLSASDIMVLPSLYEGFPFTTVEAQASGIRCIVSDAVTMKCKMTENFTFVSLEKDKWVDEIIRSSTKYDRVVACNNAKKAISDSGYYIKTNVNKLKVCYEKFGKKNDKL